MPHTRDKIANQVATKLVGLEAKLDEAIAAAGELMALMPAARLEARVGVSVGHQAILHASNALSGLIAARGSAVAAHEELATVRDQLDLQVVAGGDLWKLPLQAGLRLVSNERQAA